VSPQHGSGLKILDTRRVDPRPFHIRRVNISLFLKIWEKGGNLSFVKNNN
jgi:hypothetical protein